MFAVGAVVGSAATWMILKSKYEQRVQEEIESVKEAFIEMNRSDEQTEEDSEDEAEASEEYHQVNWEELEDLDEELDEYADLTNLYSSEKGGAEKVEVKKPYVIEPLEFDENGFRTMELTYYADNILEDENHDIVTDVDELLGEGSLDTFGLYEDDSVFVRNEHLRMDFQILRDPRTYEEATGNTPDRVRGR
jgi:hypothetical protein